MYGKNYGFVLEKVTTAQLRLLQVWAASFICDKMKQWKQVQCTIAKVVISNT